MFSRSLDSESTPVRTHVVPLVCSHSTSPPLRSNRVVDYRGTVYAYVPQSGHAHGECPSHYYLDPNGIMVEFCRDTPSFTPDPAAARDSLG